MAAVLAAVILLAYLHRYRQSVRDSGVPVTVLVAKSLIEKGTSGDVIANQDLYSVSSKPKGEVSDGAITDPATLKGRVASADIYPGEQLTLAKLSAATTGSLANRLNADQRAVSVPVDGAHGMIGQIEAGDHIDIYAGFNVQRVGSSGVPDPSAPTRPVLKLIATDILVLNAPEAGARGIGGGGKTALTLRLDDREAADVAFAADNGTLWTVLRPRANAAATSPDIVSAETLLLGVSPVAVYRSLGGRR
jgi:pilus assembly protein CpaB